jgi:glycosyltransferase involved in cell wall biosynthesis
MRSIVLALTLPYDLVFATSTPLTAGIPGIFARWLRRKPFVFEVRDLWPELPREMKAITNPVLLRLMDWLEWVSYRSATACIALSPGIVQGIARRGIPADRIAMIPNGCDLDIFSPQEVVEPIEGIAPDDLVAAFTGAHGRANGLDAVLDAAALLLKRQRRDIKLLFIGDGALKPGLVARAQSQDLDNCIFLAPVPKRELAAIMARADVGLMILANVPAFYYGTSPNKFFDYIASGLPVLNNYPGWLADLITMHRCGLAVPPDDPCAFADALEYLADHRHELLRMGLDGRALAEREFGRQQLADKFVHWLDAAQESWR